MKKICFITGTRADYGILMPIMKKIKAFPDATLQIIATNMHLALDYGLTYKEIEKDGFLINCKIESLIPGNTSESTVKSMAKVQSGLADAFNELKPDIVVILGDRYEALASASAAVTFGIPVAHLHGGEITEGAIDDMFRNAITMLSSIHFASTAEYAANITRMTGSTNNVYLVGAPGADINDLKLNSDQLTKEFLEKTGLRKEDKFILFTMHSVTKLPDLGISEIKETIKALKESIDEGYKILVTLPNSDPGNVSVTELLIKWHKKYPSSVICVKSLGSGLFHYAMSTASLMIGNSSAALIEAPSHYLPSINIGYRQKGRSTGPSVINVKADSNEIKSAIIRGLTLEFKKKLLDLSFQEINPYYKPKASEFIAEKLLEYKKEEI